MSQLKIDAVYLDPDKVVETTELLARRINERFPQAGLNQVCAQLLQLSRSAKQRSAAIARPLYGIRLLSGMFVGLILTAFVGILSSLDLKRFSELESKDLIQVLDSGFQTLLLIGATLLFLITLERRIKRNRALKAIHELRAISHIVDMHQLTKDPERLITSGPDTASSPKRTMTRFQLYRYLDYCSEMLSLAGKLAALYVQNFEDTEAVSAVNDLEDLTSGLSRKIWQKIMMLQTAPEKEPT